MRIWIDGDGCPVVNIAIKMAKTASVPVTVVKNYAVEVKDPYATVVTVDISRDAADFYIVNHMANGDIVISQDYGLAAMVLSKNGLCINQNGRQITRDNIDLILDQRHHSRVERTKNKKYTKFKKRSEEDNQHFMDAFAQVLQQASQGTSNS